METESDSATPKGSRSAAGVLTVIALLMLVCIRYYEIQKARDEAAAASIAAEKAQGGGNLTPQTSWPANKSAPANADVPANKSAPANANVPAKPTPPEFKPAVLDD